MSFSVSESSEKSDKIKNQFYSTNKQNAKKNKLYKSINSEYNEEDSNKINKTKEDDFNDNNDIRSITKIYKYITKTLEKFIEKNYSQVIFVNNTLRMIYSHIKVLLSSLKKEKNSEQKNDTLDNNQKLLYEIKINDLNQQLKDLKYEFNLLNTNESNKLDDLSPKKFKIYNYLKRKNLKLENKTKIDEFKYLLCIKEQQNKINELENKLKLAILENSKEVKESKCFPIITKINLISDKNPKSIPLTQTLLKNSNSTKRNLSKPTGDKYDCFFTITNSTNKTRYNILSEKKKQNQTNPKKIGIKEDLFKSIKIKKIKENSKDKNLDKRSEADIHFNNLKLNSQIIPNRDTNFFISHPNLSLAGYDQKINKYKINLPNKLFSFKFGKNFSKNGRFQFPSTLNEIFVELEKLRIYAKNTEFMNNMI